MEDFQLTNNFWLSEVIPRRQFEHFGKNGIWLIDIQIVYAAQFLRDKIGKPCVINNWKFAGDFEFSGFRPYDCGIGAKYSQHKFGRALDLKFIGMSAEEVRQFIRDKWDTLKLWKYFTTIEKDTPSWVHIDRRAVNSEKLFEVPYQ